MSPEELDIILLNAAIEYEINERMKLSTETPKRPIPKVDPSTTNCGSYHNLDCTSSLSQLQYDDRCVRCKKIKQVIALKRKTIRNGASQFEAETALRLADRIISSVGLTRGEVFDPLYQPPKLIISPKPKSRPQPVRTTTNEDFNV